MGSQPEAGSGTPKWEIPVQFISSIDMQNKRSGYNNERIKPETKGLIQRNHLRRTCSWPNANLNFLSRPAVGFGVWDERCSFLAPSGSFGHGLRPFEGT